MDYNPAFKRSKKDSVYHVYVEFLNIIFHIITKSLDIISHMIIKDLDRYSRREAVFSRSWSYGTSRIRQTAKHF